MVVVLEILMTWKIKRKINHHFITCLDLNPLYRSKNPNWRTNRSSANKLLDPIFFTPQNSNLYQEWNLVMKRSLLLLITLISPYAHADNKPQSHSPAIQHVIYVTLDGVRWQDIYKTQHYFPKLWDKYADKLNFYGLPN